MEIMQQDEQMPARWRCEKIMLADLESGVADVLRDLGQNFRDFVVVTNDSGRASALLSTEDFLGMLEALRQSRFPGDRDPTSLSMRELILVEHGFDFYIFDLNASSAHMSAALAQLPPRHTLVLENGRIHSVIPRSDFSSWIRKLTSARPTTYAPAF